MVHNFLFARRKLHGWMGSTWSLVELRMVWMWWKKWKPWVRKVVPREFQSPFVIVVN